MFYSQQNNVSKLSTQAVLIDKDILTDPNNFQNTLDKFDEISEHELHQRMQMKRSR